MRTRSTEAGASTPARVKSPVLSKGQVAGCADQVVSEAGLRALEREIPHWLSVVSSRSDGFGNLSVRSLIPRGANGHKTGHTGTYSKSGPCDFAWGFETLREGPNPLRGPVS